MACLLEDDPYPDARAQALRRARSHYVWDHSYLRPLPLLKIPRKPKMPSILEFFRGTFLELPPDERPKDGVAERRLAATAPGVLHIELDRLITRFNGAFRDPQDYLSLIQGLEDPPHLAGGANFAASWDSDFAFAWQRLAGPNPVVVERPGFDRFRELNERLGLQDEHLVLALGEGAPTLEAAMEHGRLLFCDYGILCDPAPIPCGSLRGADKHLIAPILALVWDDRRDEPVPVAIRLGQTCLEPLRIRENSERWRVAKALVSIADFNHHEMGTHLALTHFLQEGMAVATYRTLPPQHPVAALLAPHFEYLLFNNFAGRELLVQPGGYVETILAGDREEGSLALVQRFYERFHFDDLDLPASLVRRGVMSAMGLPTFPYRDDGLQLWAAIDTWVRAYVTAYYASDERVALDVELQRWANEMTSPEGAHLRGFPEGFDSIDALARALTRIVFLAGPHHAAVNYAQYASMMVVPNMAGASWCEAPDRLIDLLPPMKAAHAQVQAMWTLTCFQHGQLGQYGGALRDQQIQEPLRIFQEHLAAIEARIQSANQQGIRKRAPYTYLLPSRVPNSTNV